MIPIVLHITKIKFVWYVKGLIYLVFLSPTYVIIFGIYSACNIHDISWGSRPGGDSQVISNEEKEKEKLKTQTFEDFRAMYFICWGTVNIILGYILIEMFWD